MSKESVFSYLSQNSGIELITGKPTCGLKKKLKQAVHDNLYPSIEEEYRFLQTLWYEIREGYYNWEVSTTKQGRLLASMLDGNVDFDEGMMELKCKFIVKLRRKIVRRCFKIAFVDMPLLNEQKFQLLRVLYEGKLYTAKFETANAEKVNSTFKTYFKNLGYEIVDENVVNPSSTLYLADKGLLPLTPITFNLGITPQMLNKSIAIHDEKDDKLGWSVNQLSEAISSLGVKPEDTRLKLIAQYRKLFGTDGYIDWALVRKYKYISENNLKVIAFNVFNRSPDTFEGASYSHIVDELELMSDTALGLTKKSEEILQTKEGKVEGRNLISYAYILRSATEDVTKAFWYTNFDGQMNLIFEANPIKSELIRVDYTVFEWALERKDEISAAYFIFVAQRLGIWDYIKANTLLFDSASLADGIDKILTSLMHIEQ